MREAGERKKLATSKGQWRWGGSACHHGLDQLLAAVRVMCGGSTVRGCPTCRSAWWRTGGRWTKGANYYWVLLPEGQLTRGSLTACCAELSCCQPRCDCRCGDGFGTTATE